VAKLRPSPLVRRSLLDVRSTLDVQRWMFNVHLLTFALSLLSSIRPPPLLRHLITGHGLLLLPFTSAVRPLGHVFSVIRHSIFCGSQLTIFYDLPLVLCSSFDVGRSSFLPSSDIRCLPSGSNPVSPIIRLSTVCPLITDHWTLLSNYKSENALARHSCEGRNPVISIGSSLSGLRFSPE